MKLTDRAEEILERLWIEIIEHKKLTDINVLKDNDGIKELLEAL